MRPLSFLFAALLGVVLAMIAPALAGPRPEAAPLQASTLAWATEAVAPESQVADDVLPAGSLAAEPVAVDEDMTVEEISRSILETVNALSDAA